VSAAELAEQTIERCVSIDANFLNQKGVITSKELRKDLKLLNEELQKRPGGGTRYTQSRHGNNKAGLIRTVIEARRELGTEWLRQRRETLDAEQPSSNAQEAIAEELKLPLFDPALDHADLLVFQEKQHSFAIPNWEPVLELELELAQPQDGGDSGNKSAQPMSQDSAASKTGFTSGLHGKLKEQLQLAKSGCGSVG